ncbi:MAG: lysylphosphatidylglycerol synthase transmembrane domain-containing protein [Chloroflexota bacterium]
MQISLGCVISAAAIVFLLQKVSLQQVAQQLSSAEPLPILLLVAAVIGSLVTRAIRWGIFFLPDRHVPLRPLFGTLAISYMASTFLPLRAGELLRPVFLGQRAGLSAPRVLATILLEKLFDFLALAVMLALLVATTPLPDLAQAAGVTITTFILVGFGFVVGLAIWRTPTLKLVGFAESRLPLGLGGRLRLGEAARQFAEGTDPLRVPRVWALLLSWSAITWLFALASGWFGALALGVHLGVPALLFLTVLTSTGQAVPSSPGYLGVYHAAATFALTFFGIDNALALAIALVTWAVTYGTLVVVGLIAFWTGGYTFRDLLAGARGQGTRMKTAPISADPLHLAPDS